MPAPDARAAAQVLPGNYWYSLMRVPGRASSRAPARTGNGINENIKSQAEWIRLIKTDSCESCHQLGNKGTREIPKSLGVFDSSAAAWERRVQSGQAGGAMPNGMNNLGAAARSRCSATGPTASRPASCRRRRRGRRAPSVTS